MSFLYIGVLCFIFVISGMLDFIYSLNVFRQPLRLFKTIVPVMILLLCWDAYAISQDTWLFNERYVTGIRLFTIPIEEWLFFIVTPLAAILTVEAVQKVFKRIL